MPIRPTRPLRPRASIRFATAAAAGVSPANHNRAASLLPGHDRPGGQELLPAAARCEPTRRDHQRRLRPQAAAQGSTRPAAPAPRPGSACVRGGDSGTPRGTSKIRSRGYPAASSSRRAAGLLATKACARRQAALDAAAAGHVDLAETIAVPAGPLRHEHHRKLRSHGLHRGPGLVHQAPDTDQIELLGVPPQPTGQRAGPAPRAPTSAAAAGRDARRGCHDNRFPPASASATGP